MNLANFIWMYSFYKYDKDDVVIPIFENKTLCMSESIVISDLIIWLNEYIHSEYTTYTNLYNLFNWLYWNAGLPKVS